MFAADTQWQVCTQRFRPPGSSGSKVKCSLPVRPLSNRPSVFLAALPFFAVAAFVAVPNRSKHRFRPFVTFFLFLCGDDIFITSARQSPSHLVLALSGLPIVAPLFHIPLGSLQLD